MKKFAYQLFLADTPNTFPLKGKPYGLFTSLEKVREFISQAPVSELERWEVYRHTLNPHYDSFLIAVKVEWRKSRKDDQI